MTCIDVYPVGVLAARRRAVRSLYRHGYRGPS
jgi:hypothetical protein